MNTSAIGIIFLLLCVILFLAVRLSGRRRAGNAGKAGDARLKRIKIVSDLVGTLIVASLAIGAPYSLAVYLGWLPLLPGHKILISPHQLYASASDIPENVMALALVRWGLGVFCALVIYKLFRLYGAESFSRQGTSSISGCSVII